MRRVKRWAGPTRTASDWDGLRRDPELWDEHGDCLVHLYAAGQSRRGPSFCLPFRLLNENDCGSMFSLGYAYTAQSIESVQTPHNGNRKIDLYIPASGDNTRQASFQWHITTRNFFALITGKPLVGTHLGQAMVDLQERMHLFQPGRVDSYQSFLNYADAQGYRDYVNFPDYALAMLYYAEHYKLREAWIDAFAHCVGMNARLVLSPEFPFQSRLTMALITRASLEMDIELGRTTEAIRNFLEDDLSPAHLGLTKDGRNHLDQLRSFLHSFYVDKFGYWPPPKGTPFSKPLFRSLYFDFKNLYDFLVDSESTTDLASQKLASGGICVLQNIDSYDRRHKFPPLPHPLPLIPCNLSAPEMKRSKSQLSFKSLAMGAKPSKDERHLGACAALITATNDHVKAPIITAYTQFETQCVDTCTEGKTSIADARKVRWLLIYGTLQNLISALRAPAEVRDTESPEYHLNCLITEHAQWQNITQPDRVPASPSASSFTTKHPTEPTIGIDTTVSMARVIEPDCQSNDYLQHTNTDFGSRRVSVEIPAPLKILQPSQSSSSHSRRRLSLPSLSIRRNSISLKPQVHCEILVPGYGNGLNDALVDSQPRAPSQTPVITGNLKKRSSSTTIVKHDGALTRQHTSAPTPHQCDQSSRERESCCVTTIDPSLLGQDETVGWYPRLTHPLKIDASVDSTAPPTSSKTVSPGSSLSHWWSDGASPASSISSVYDEQLESKISLVEESGLLGGLVPITSPSLISRPTTPARRSSLAFGFNKQSAPTKKRATSSEDLGIGVAVTDSGSSTPRTLSLLTYPASGSGAANKGHKSGNRLSGPISRRSLSFSRKKDLSSLTMTAISPAPVAPDPDGWPLRVSGNAEPPCAGTSKLERKLSFWKR